jgi:hypothetical protein
LFQLGDDILYRILRLVASRDLCALCLSCKSLRTAGEPALYSKIEWRWVSYRTPPISAFLRTILHRPDLADHVRSLVLGGKSPSVDEHLPLTIIDKLDRQNVLRAVSKIEVHFGPAWRRSLIKGEIQASLALVLSQLHHLRHLVIGQIFANKTWLLGRVLRAALFEKGHFMLPAFEQLQGVTYGPIDVDCSKNRGTHARDMLLFFYLPQARRFSIAFDNPATFQWPISTPPNSSTITELNLETIQESHLSHLLSATPRLKVLRWMFYHCKEHTPGPCTALVDLDLLGTALNHVRSTLTELAIAVRSSPRSLLRFQDLKMTGSLKALVDFCQLETLEAPLQLLAASFKPENGIPLKNVVPRHIRSLVITDDLVNNSSENDWENTDVIDTIAQWLADRTVSKPNLRTISLSLQSYHSDWSDDMTLRLAELCSTWGVEANITKKDDDL